MFKNGETVVVIVPAILLGKSVKGITFIKGIFDYDAGSTYVIAIPTEDEKKDILKEFDKKLVVGLEDINSSIVDIVRVHTETKLINKDYVEQQN